MVEIIRNKWCDDLEDLLQCPICMNRPQRWIYQCIQGHHICEDCKIQLSLCPTCSQRWSTARNRFAESLCSKLDEIKLSLIDPESEINKLLIPDRVSIASQTEAETVTPRATAKNAVDDHNGAYPCRIGGCNTTLFYEPLMKHIQTNHCAEYVELPMGEGNVFQNIWFFDFAEQMTFDRVFVVPSMGTFFLKLSSDVFGNFTGFVLMLHNGFIAKHFTYQLEIACCAEHNTRVTYTAEICSCRTPATVLRQKSLQINRADIQRMLEHQQNLSCTVLLGRQPLTEEQEAQPKPNYQKKKYSKNKNNAGKLPPTNVQNRPMPGPSNCQGPSNGQHRPQSVNEQQQQQQQQQVQRWRDMSLQSRGHLTNMHRNPPNRASSIPSLLYPNLRNIQ